MATDMKKDFFGRRIDKKIFWGMGKPLKFHFWVNNLSYLNWLWDFDPLTYQSLISNIYM